MVNMIFTNFSFTGPRVRCFFVQNLHSRNTWGFNSVYGLMLDKCLRPMIGLRLDRKGARN